LLTLRQYHWRASTLVPPCNLADSEHVSESYLQFNALGDMYGMYAENKAHWLMDMVPRADGSQCTGAKPNPPRLPVAGRLFLCVRLGLSPSTPALARAAVRLDRAAHPLSGLTQECVLLHIGTVQAT
jgi:hypothetical protein